LLDLDISTAIFGPVYHWSFSDIQEQRNVLTTSDLMIRSDMAWRSKLDAVERRSLTWLYMKCTNRHRTLFRLLRTYTSSRKVCIFGYSCSPSTGARLRELLAVLLLMKKRDHQHLELQRQLRWQWCFCWKQEQANPAAQGPG
jgi:hypothetical protein